MKHDKKQDGFTILEGLLLVLLVGFIGATVFFVTNRQKDNTANNSANAGESKSAADSAKASGTDQKNTAEVKKPTTIDEAIVSLENKFRSLVKQQTAYLIEEKYDGVTTNGTFRYIREDVLVPKDGAYTSYTPSPTQSFKYRTKPSDSGPDGYKPYVLATEKTAADLATFAENDLGLKKVDSHEVESNAGYKFSFALFEFGDNYCQVSGGAGDIGVSCIPKSDVK